MPLANIYRRFLQLGLLAVCPWSQASHPLISEDPFVQGSRNQQLELNTDKTLSPDPRQGLSNLSYTYGVSDYVDVFLNVSARYTSIPGQADSSAGFKYQISNTERHSWGVKTSISWPNGNYAKGLGGEQKQVAVNIVHSYLAGDVNFLSNATLYFKRSVKFSSLGNTQVSVSQAMIYQATPTLRLALDAGLQNSEQKNSTRWYKQLVLGVIYSPDKNCDFDLGLRWQQQASAWQRAIGAGITWRM